MFTDNMFPYSDYSKESIRKQLTPRNEFSRGIGYKINKQKSVFFPIH